MVALWRDLLLKGPSPPRHARARGESGSQFAGLVADIGRDCGVDPEPASRIGRRVVVTGMAGAGKSTFSKALSAKTGLPLIHLDLHFWKPGWVAPSDDEWREKQRSILAGDAWIADGNYHETLDLRLERADTVVYLDTPWWTCARRALVRGIRRPAGSVMPEGCEDSTWQRVRDEWGSSGRSGAAVAPTVNGNSTSCLNVDSTRLCTYSIPRHRSVSYWKAVTPSRDPSPKDWDWRNDAPRRER